MSQAQDYATNFLHSLEIMLQSQEVRYIVVGVGSAFIGTITGYLLSKRNARKRIEALERNVSDISQKLTNNEQADREMKREGISLARERLALKSRELDYQHADSEHTRLMERPENERREIEKRAWRLSIAEKLKEVLKPIITTYIERSNRDLSSNIDEAEYYENREAYRQDLVDDWLASLKNDNENRLWGENFGIDEVDEATKKIRTVVDLKFPPLVAEPQLQLPEEVKSLLDLINDEKK